MIATERMRKLAEAPATAETAAAATKYAFLMAYARELTDRYAWARDDAKLSKFLDTVLGTLLTKDHLWSPEGEACAAALKSVGLPKRVTVKALRALPRGNAEDFNPEK